MTVLRILNIGAWGMLFAFLLSGCSRGPALEAKIGQMLMVGFRGTSVAVDDPIADDIRHRNLGGVVLFDVDVASGKRKRNIESPAQLAALVSDLQRFAGVPLLIAVDQEGGRVARLKERDGFPPTSSHTVLGAQADLSLTLAETSRLAATLRRAGVTLNLAPVVDLCSNPDNPVIARLERCFSADPQQVTEQAGRYIAAHHRQGILSTVKHFPGHGSSQDDSHLGLVDVTKSWSEAELIPYRQLIKAGQVDAVMTAHVFNARLDAEYPATLSRATITGILRQRLGFTGVVISDDLQMRAIVAHFGFETAISKALEAGVDILLFGNNLDYDEQIVPRAIAVIKKLVAQGVVDEARVDRSYQRILKLKQRFNSF